MGIGALPRARAKARRCCARDSAPTQTIRAVDWGEPVDINGVRVSLHPAGHILGSAQIRVEHRGEVWVASGDYKTEPDPTCTPFELVRCHTFITESTFGLPDLSMDAGQRGVRRHPRVVAREPRRAAARRVLFGYALGKAQRLLAGLADADIGPVYTHGAVERLNRDYRASGVRLADDALRERDAARARLRGQSDRRAAVGGGQHMAAAVRRRLHRLRVRLDACARRSATSRARSRLRALRSRRLAVASRGGRGDGRRARVGDARVRASRSCAG